MGYRDDFYVKENIIGYTGDLKGLPTVYFKRTIEGGFDEWARITQVYPDNRANEGRAFVRKNRSYVMRNEMDTDGMHGVEYVNGAHHHTSRNEFHAVTGGTLDVLAESITRFPNVRKRHEKYVAVEHHNYSVLDEVFGIGGTT